MNRLVLYCCGCNNQTTARLTTGEEIYPHRKDLSLIPFWICDRCGNYVGCYYKSRWKTKPLGPIPSNEIRKARSEIHKILDPIWKSRIMSRSDVYKIISEHIGKDFHTAEITNIEDARDIYRFIKTIPLRNKQHTHHNI